MYLNKSHPRCFGRFLNNESGNFSILLGVVISALLLTTGATVDYIDGTNAQQRLQNFADRALIDAVASSEDDRSELKKRIRLSLAEDIPTAEVDVQFFGPDNKNVRVSAKYQKDLLIMGAFGFEPIDVTALAEAVIPTDGFKLNLALALDTTLSMADFGRIDDLKIAATELVDTVSRSAVNPGDVKVSMVPFSEYVRIDESNRGASWLEIQPEIPLSYTVLDEDKSVNCVSSSGENSATVCQVSVYKTITEPTRWEGCMGSRKDGAHLYPEYGGKLLQGTSHSSNCHGGYNAMMPLTENFPKIKDAIDSLETIGNTYIPAGIMWAWRTLDYRLPFDEAKFSNQQETRNVLLLMTDGTNSVTLNGERADFNGIYHWNNLTADRIEDDKIEANKITLEICDSIKHAGIEIITIPHEVNDSDTLDILKSCASSESFFIPTFSGDELKEAFRNVGTNLAVKARLTR